MQNHTTALRLSMLPGFVPQLPMYLQSLSGIHIFLSFLQRGYSIKCPCSCLHASSYPLLCNQQTNVHERSFPKQMEPQLAIVWMSEGTYM